MTLANNGDKHNFGQVVERIVGASGTQYRKPRTVFWEHLFFGVKSPLKPIFEKAGENDNRPLADYLFNLDIEIKHPWLGFASEIKKSNFSITDRHFYSFGVLLGYCFLFGIRDLHWGNIIVQKNHLQVVDAEVVLVNLHLPHETILLSFKDIGFESCGASLLGKNLSEFTQHQKEKIFAGYFDVANRILDHQKAILEILASDDVKNNPIRVILKNTAVYRAHIENPKSEQMLPEELAQMNRGDVPYFYKNLGNEELWYWAQLRKPEAVYLTDATTTKDVQRHGVSPQALLGAEAELLPKVASGALYLIKALSPEGFVLKDGAHDDIQIGHSVSWHGREYKRA